MSFVLWESPIWSVLIHRPTMHHYGSVCAAGTFVSRSPGGISYNCDLFSHSGAVVINPGMCTCGYVCVKLEVDVCVFLFERINI